MRCPCPSYLWRLRAELLKSKMGRLGYTRAWGPGNHVRIFAPTHICMLFITFPIAGFFAEFSLVEDLREDVGVHHGAQRDSSQPDPFNYLLKRLCCLSLYRARAYLP